MKTFYGSRHEVGPETHNNKVVKKIQVDWGKWNRIEGMDRFYRYTFLITGFLLGFVSCLILTSLI